MSRSDPEMLAISRIMAIVTPLSPIARARVLDYVTSRCESLGMPQPAKPARQDDMMFEEVEPAPTLVDPWAGRAA